jgi:hypothetical protein
VSETSFPWKGRKLAAAPFKPFQVEYKIVLENEYPRRTPYPTFIGMTSFHQNPLSLVPCTTPSPC